jgi:hypothetical protein
VPGGPVKFQPNGTTVRFNGQIETKEPATLPLGLDHIRYRLQHARSSVKPNAVTVRQFDPILGATNEAPQQILAARFDGGRSKRSGDGKLRHGGDPVRFGAPGRTRTCDPRLRGHAKGGNQGQHGAAAPVFPNSQTRDYLSLQHQPLPIVSQLSVV